MGGTGTSTMTYTYLGDGTRVAARAGADASSHAGKEEQNIAGMNLRLLDFGARYYDSFTCRWNAVDPLAHKYFPMSPYNYCGNDPVNFLDPDGNERDTSKNEADSTITITARYYYDKKIFGRSVLKAVQLLNSKTDCTYTDPKTKKRYRIIFNLSAYDIHSTEGENLKYASGSNSISELDKKIYTDDGKFVTGGT